MGSSATVRATGVTILAAALLSGCAGSGIGAQRIVEGLDAEGRRETLAAAGGTVYLTAAHPPAGSAGEASARMADAATGAVFGMPTAFTADPARAGRTALRIVGLFDAPVTTRPERLCAADWTDTTVARDGGRTRLFLVFCSGERPLAGARVVGPAIADLADPMLVALTRVGIQEMFLPLRERDRDRPGLWLGF